MNLISGLSPICDALKNSEAEMLATLANTRLRLSELTHSPMEFWDLVCWTR